MIPKEKQDIYEGVLHGQQAFCQQYAPVWLQAISKTFRLKYGTTLIDLNDNYQYSFLEIADLLEADANEDDEQILNIFLKHNLEA